MTAAHPEDAPLIAPRLRRAAGSLGMAALVCVQSARAASAPFAAPAAPLATSSAGGLLRVSVALIVVLAAVVGAAWLARRLRGFGAVSHGGLEILQQLPLGARERVVLLRVGTRQLLLGVANGSVNMLHVLDAAEPASSAAPAANPRPNFKELLWRSLGK